MGYACRTVVARNGQIAVRAVNDVARTQVRNRNRRTADRNVLDIAQTVRIGYGEGAGCMHGGITNMGTGGQTGLVYHVGGASRITGIGNYVRCMVRAGNGNRQRR